MWGQLLACQVEEVRALEFSRGRTVRQIFAPPSMSGVVVNHDGDETEYSSPFDNDGTCERTFQDDGVPKDSLYHRCAPTSSAPHPPRSPSALCPPPLTGAPAQLFGHVRGGEPREGSDRGGRPADALPGYDRYPGPPEAPGYGAAAAATRLASPPPLPADRRCISRG
jgi:hypothetical protein